MRILLLECSPLLRRWPKTARAWQDHLPTFSQRQRFWSDIPQARVDWAKTRRQGWPPQAFAIRRRHRSTDQVTLSVLAWTLRRLEAAFSASESLVGPHATAIQDLSTEVETIIRRTVPLLDLLDEADESTPSRDSLNALKGSGWPWNVVAEVATVFASLDRGGSEALARRLLRPDGFPESIFQLSVLGVVLLTAQNCGAEIVSLRPIGYMTDGPVYRIKMPDQEPWDLWCEAASCWKTYGLSDGYRDLAATLTASTGTAFQARNIRPDVLFARPGDRALVLECKFPSETLDPGYVAHGMYQAAFYGHQLAPAFLDVSSYSIGPPELVPTHGQFLVDGVVVGLTSPTLIEDLVTSMLLGNAAS